MRKVRMREWRRVFVMAFALTAALVWGSGVAMAGISNTKHNLGSTGTGNRATDTGEICVFCHTPHGADTSAPVPLWNKKLEVATPTYTTYASLGTTTLDALQADIGSVSLACLSCHDGTQAMDNLINAPGSGGYAADGGGVGGLAYTWVDGGNGTVNTTTGAMQTGGDGAPFPMLGTDLSNDHPISIQYAGGGYDSTDGNALVAAETACTGCTDPDFFEPSKATLGTSPVWWVNTTGGASNNREKVDMILYTRTGSGGNDTGSDAAGWGGNEEPFVECASCHDPHTENATFLRVVNTGSAVCLACHNK